MELYQSLRLKYSDIMIDRHPHSTISSCSRDCSMITLDIIGEVTSNCFYIMENKRLLSISSSPTFREEKVKLLSILPSHLQYCRIPNRWDQTVKLHTTSSNILGNSGRLQLDYDLEIPCSDISHIEFYSAILVQQGDIIQFDTDTELPICIVHIGKNYVERYIMMEAGGVYLEYHNRPHFHMPLNSMSSGYLILGKKVGDEIMLSAFRIPFEYGVYIPPNIIHNDLFLVGEYLVVYSKTEQYSTVLLQNRFGKPIQVSIVV